MIDVAWLNDGRSPKIDDYLVPWNDEHSRQKTFLVGWTRYLRHGHHEKDVLHWQTVGAYYAGIFGDLPVAQRRQLYYAALAEYCKSQRCVHWTDEQRQQALNLAREAPGLKTE